MLNWRAPSHGAAEPPAARPGMTPQLEGLALRRPPRPRRQRVLEKRLWRSTGLPSLSPSPSSALFGYRWASDRAEGTQADGAQPPAARTGRHRGRAATARPTDGRTEGAGPRCGSGSPRPEPGARRESGRGERGGKFRKGREGVGAA